MAEDVAEILAQVGRTYGELNSYSDRGYVLSKKHPDEPFEKDKTFTTYFRRPNYFRFEWTYCDQFAHFKSKANTPSILWSDGKNVYLNFSFSGKVEQVKSLRMAIAGATGVSGGTAHTISALLMKEVGGRTIIDDANLNILSEQLVSDELCYLLGGNKKEEQYYISKSQKTVLKIDRDMVIDPMAMEKELGSERFKSFNSFMTWLIFKFATRAIPKTSRGASRLIETHVYEEVNLNPDLPDEIFSEAGMISSN